MKKYLLVAIAPLILLLGSCTGSSQQEQEQTVPSDTIVEPDTLSIEQQVVEWEANDTLYHAFLDADEALLYMEKSSHAKQYKEGILPRMARENLPYCERLMNNRFDYFIVVDKASMRVLLYNRYGVKEKEYPCACARNYGHKAKKGDCRTPEGFFYAGETFDSTDWLYTDDNGYTSPVRGQYGPRFIRIKGDKNLPVGIHGTCAPWALGRRCSHGCIRIHNDNILELVKYVQPNIPIIINPGPKDMWVNESEGREIPVITIDDNPVVAKPHTIAKPEETKPEVTTDTLPEQPQTIEEDSTEKTQPQSSEVEETPDEDEADSLENNL